MVSRERILEAAARVYAKHGFKGATTRLIATEAEVNEVTLFRTFGSKGALLHAVLMQHIGDRTPVTLPAVPRDPAVELRDFIQDSLDRMAELRPLLIHTMSEIGDRPEARAFACRGRKQVHDTITAYLRHLSDLKIVDATLDVDVAALMLTGIVIADVMGRSVVPGIYPASEDIANRYTSLFLRMIGLQPALPLPVSSSLHS